jgi:hypothetical protein
MTGVLLFSLIGGLISRWHGGGFFPAPKALKNVVWAAPFAVAAFLFTGNVPLSILALVLCIAGKAYRAWSLLILGTGGRIRKGYWHDFAGLTVSLRFLAVSGAVIAFGTDRIYRAALIITIGGLLKGAAYAIGWSIYPRGTGKGIPWLNEATAIGEFLTGVAAYAALGIGVQLI